MKRFVAIIIAALTIGVVHRVWAQSGTAIAAPAAPAATASPDPDFRLKKVELSGSETGHVSVPQARVDEERCRTAGDLKDCRVRSGYADLTTAASPSAAKPKPAAAKKSEAKPKPADCAKVQGDLATCKEEGDALRGEVDVLKKRVGDLETNAKAAPPTAPPAPPAPAAARGGRRGGAAPTAAPPASPQPAEEDTAPFITHSRGGTAE